MKTDIPAIEVNDLKLAYGKTDAVNGLNLQVRAGRCYGLFGRNGAGKTTSLCPGPELLILDEPTSGLDPLVRREFIRTVIGAYQEADPDRRTVFVSTHLITEFEGLIDEFTLMENGRDILTLDSDAARQRYTRIRVRWADRLQLPDQLNAIDVQTQGREAEILLNGNHDKVFSLLKETRPEHLTTEGLSLEEIFLAGLKEHQLKKTV